MISSSALAKFLPSLAKFHSALPYGELHRKGESKLLISLPDDFAQCTCQIFFRKCTRPCTLVTTLHYQYGRVNVFCFEKCEYYTIQQNILRFLKTKYRQQDVGIPQFMSSIPLPESVLFRWVMKYFLIINSHIRSSSPSAAHKHQSTCSLARILFLVYKILPLA